MSTEYPQPQGDQARSSSLDQSRLQPTASEAPSGAEKDPQAEQTEAGAGSPLASASVESSRLAPSEPAEETSESAEAKKRRILIGSQRDPSLFTQYKPKPTLSIPERGPVRHRPTRRRKPKRPRYPTPPVTPTPEPVSEPAAPAIPEAPLGIEPLIRPGAALEQVQGSTSPVGGSSLGRPEPSSASLAESLPPVPPTEVSLAKPIEPALPVEPALSVPLSAQASGAQISSLPMVSAGSALGATVPPESQPAEAATSPIREPATRLEGDTRKEPELPASSGQAEAPEIAPPPQSSPLTPTGLDPKQKYPLPNLRSQLAEDLAAELQEALAAAPVEQLLIESAASAQAPLFEPESRHQARVVRIHRDEVFVELGSREQGVVPLKQFIQPPEIGQQIEVIVQRFAPEEGLYELTLPASAALVAEWNQLAEGMLVEARVTGHNTGGLECEVGHIRGFIPISMVDLYRVHDLAEYVGQKFLCKVIECNPQRGNLVLSRRAVLEQQREAARQELLSSLAPGQIRQGVVRKLMPFGAFVDLGHGVDGLIPISQISWRRINHPSEVLQEGQQVHVVVEKVDSASGRISLSLRQLEEDPWLRVPEKYPPNTMLRGIVRRVMDYGAFVELEPGVEGLVHISELSHKRVWRTRDVVQEGQEVEVVILSVDAAQRRISLSIRQALPPEAPPEKPAEEQPPVDLASVQAEPSQSLATQLPPAQPAPPAKKPQENKPLKLKGGLGPSPRRGKLFGLKW